MSDKRSRVSHSSDEPSPRPVALLLAVFFSAGVSTWHWYRPLPKKVTTVSNGPFISETDSSKPKESPRFKSRWKDSGLIFPSDDSLGEPSTDTSSLAASESAGKSARSEDPDPNSVSSLAGNGELALQPFRESTQLLKQSVSQMPLPMVPVKPNHGLATPSPSEARLWTAAKKSQETVAPASNELSQSQFASPDLSNDSASPFRVPRMERASPSRGPIVSLTKDIWPDQGFAPQSETAVASNRIPASPPAPDASGLLSLSSNRIRTLDQEPETSPRTAPAFTQPGGLSKGGEPSSKPNSNASQKGNLIRQPLPKTPSTK